MIIKTLQVACDHDGCLAFFEGDAGESRALVVVKQARAQGWVASDGRQYCHEHVEDESIGEAEARRYSEYMKTQPDLGE